MTEDERAIWNATYGAVIASDIRDFRNLMEAPHKVGDPLKHVNADRAIYYADFAVTELRRWDNDKDITGIQRYISDD